MSYSPPSPSDDPMRRGIPPLDGHARAWFRRRVHSLIVDLFGRGKRQQIVRSVAVDVVDWYLERIERFLEWRDADSYRGRGYCNGEWRLNETGIRSASPEAINYGIQMLEQKTFPSLDAWLTALGKGQLGKGSDEESALFLVNDVARYRRLRAKRKRENQARKKQLGASAEVCSSAGEGSNV